MSIIAARENYDRILRSLSIVLSDLDILSGNVVADSNVSWQDVAGTCELHARAVADTLREMRTNQQAIPCFPCPHEVIKRAKLS